MHKLFHLTSSCKKQNAKKLQKLSAQKLLIVGEINSRSSGCYCCCPNTFLLSLYSATTLKILCIVPLYTRLFHSFWQSPTTKNQNNFFNEYFQLSLSLSSLLSSGDSKSIKFALLFISTNLFNLNADNKSREKCVFSVRNTLQEFYFQRGKRRYFIVKEQQQKIFAILSEVKILLKTERRKTTYS